VSDPSNPGPYEPVPVPTFAPQPYPGSWAGAPGSAGQGQPWAAAPPPAAWAPAPRAAGLSVGVAFALAAMLVLGLLVAVVVGALILRSGAGMGSGMGEAYAPYGPVEQSEPVPPDGLLGPDPVLDAYAQQCFDGDLQSCDDLFAESAPLSEYEEYASTCGGRVKGLSVYACTELD
jgi:hypothetical protein